MDTHIQEGQQGPSGGNRKPQQGTSPHVADAERTEMDLSCVKDRGEN